MNDPEYMDPYGPQNHPLPPMKGPTDKDKTTKEVVKSNFDQHHDAVLRLADEEEK